MIHITSDYKPEWREDVLRLVKEFEGESFGKMGLGLNIEMFDNAVAYQKDSSFLLFIDGRLEGLLCGVAMNAPCVKSGLVWQETVWFVSKQYRNSRYGLMLFKHACKALKERGIDTIVMAHLHDETGFRMGKIYERLGFKPLETHYIRSL